MGLGGGHLGHDDGEHALLARGRDRVEIEVPRKVELAHEAARGPLDAHVLHLMMMMLRCPGDALPGLNVDLLRRFPPPLAADLQDRVVLDLDLRAITSY